MNRKENLTNEVSMGTVKNKYFMAQKKSTFYPSKRYVLLHHLCLGISNPYVGEMKEKINVALRLKTKTLKRQF